MISHDIDPEVFISSYWLKEDLVVFCRNEGLPVSGSKAELTERVYRYLVDGTVLASRSNIIRRASNDISPHSVIGEGFVCSQESRKFFKEHIGVNFHFSVPFQAWLKSHPECTYADAVREYPNIRGDGKISPQFEYNTYIRDFFAANPGRSLNEAIICWNHRKSQLGSHRYSDEDLECLVAGNPSSGGQ